MSFDFKRMIKFEHNLGDKDKKYRMFGGAALVLISLFTAKIILLLLGTVLIGTSFFGWCPVYSGLNKNTCTSGGSESSE